MADVAADPERVLEIVSDLATYPEWLELVSAADRAPGETTDAGPAWFITLKAKVGPFSRSKRLRMVRTNQDDTSVRFERFEVDRRDHSAWVMESVVSEGPEGSVVSMELTYDGKLFTGPLETILGSVAGDAGPRLSDYASS